MRILRRIRKEFDYEAYCEENFTIKRTARSDELRICCPNCGESKFKCYVNDDKKMFNCFKCEFSSRDFDVFDFVALTEAIPRGKAVLKLMHEFAPVTPMSIEEIIQRAEGTYYDVEEDEPGPNADIKLIDSLPKQAYPLTDPQKAPEPRFWRYLLDNRGLTEEEILACNFHYVPKQSVPVTKIDGLGKEKYVGDIGRRVILPVYGPGGLVSWLSRPITDRYDGPKYVNCPDSEINRTLWPFVEPHSDIAVLVEGSFDALAVRRLGPPFSAYATFGKRVSYDQIKQLKAWGITSVILFWDVDAKKDTIKAVEDLKMQFDEVFVPNLEEWPEDYDAGDMIKPAVNEELDGLVALEKALCEPVDVNSIDFIKWQYL